MSKYSVVKEEELLEITTEVVLKPTQGETEIESEVTPTVSEELLLETTSEETAPEETTPEESIPEETTPEESTREETNQAETSPEETTAEESIPEETTPKEETTPEETNQAETTPEEITPEETIPEEKPDSPSLSPAEEEDGLKESSSVSTEKPLEMVEQTTKYVVEYNNGNFPDPTEPNYDSDDNLLKNNGFRLDEDEESVSGSCPNYSFVQDKSFLPFFYFIF